MQSCHLAAVSSVTKSPGFYHRILLVAGNEVLITTMSAPKPLSAQELLKHPGFPTNDWTERIPPTSSGYAPINSSSSRPGGPFKIHYEIHGTGPIHTVWIMGLGAFRTAWKRQTLYFGHERADRYSCLVFDNRGVGLSEKPTCRYSTREMAGDVIELLGHVGWLEADEVQRTMKSFYGKADVDSVVVKRDLNVLGVSMGGMIAQEVALLVPHRIQSLFLISTAPRLVREAPFLEHLKARASMFIPKNIDDQLRDVADRLFSQSFLAGPDTEHQDAKLNFPTNRDRFAAAEMAKRQDKAGFTMKGFILQAIAAGWHHKSKEQLQEIVKKVGGNRICIMHGTDDRMITFKHFEIFKEDMGETDGIEYSVWDGVGHVLAWESEKESNSAIEKILERAAGLSS